MEFDSQKVWLNARQASTEDLLDRITVYRPGMEPEAVEIIEAELRGRGIHQEQVEEHEKNRGEVIRLADGTAAKCSFCYRPAVTQGWGWHRLWRKVPVFPRLFYWCEEHRPDET
jgi:hypothetical protein